MDVYAPGARLITQSVSYEDRREIFDSTLTLERRSGRG